MNDSSTAGASAPALDSAVDELTRSLGVAVESSRALAGAGYTTPDQVRALDTATLTSFGLTSVEIDRIHSENPKNGEGGAALAGEQIVDRWMDQVRKAEKGRRRRVSTVGKDSKQVLRKWVDGDDSVMESWIQSGETAIPEVPVVAPPPPEVPGAAPETPTPPPIPSQIIEREETVVRWLTGLLDRVKSDQFDPTSMVQEVQDLHRQLYDERTRRKQLEDEVEHVKRGSIAVIKYVRGREAKERDLAIQTKDAEIAELKLKLLALEGSTEGGETTEAASSPRRLTAPLDAVASSEAVEKASRETERKMREEFAEREHTFIGRETELRRRIVQLEGEVRNLRSEAQLVEGRESMLKQERGGLSDEIDSRLRDGDARERDLVARENELRTRFEEIRLSNEELERKRAPLAFKEKELAAWEQQVITMKQAIELEARRIERARLEINAGGSVVSSDEARRLDDLRNELTRKEEELMSREAAIRERLVELERLQPAGAQAEADQIHEAAVQSAKEEKVRSGVRRLDDLLYGGYGLSSQVLVNGPTHTGKDVLARLFAAEGLRQGIPIIWVVTDKTFGQIRDEMTSLLPNYPEHEKKGLVRYVDLYSRGLGVQQSEPGVRLLSTTDKGVLDQLTQAVNAFSTEYRESYPSYRLVFETASTLTAYLDIQALFRFLQPFVGRRKLDGAVSYYLLETGMHTDSDLQTLEHMMDGSLHLKVEQLKTFLSVRGLGDVQSRAWVGYTFSKKTFSLGSFSLDHIR